jgi:hypothetical protein
MAARRSSSLSSVMTTPLQPLVSSLLQPGVCSLGSCPFTLHVLPIDTGPPLPSSEVFRPDGRSTEWAHPTVPLTTHSRAPTSIESNTTHNGIPAEQVVDQDVERPPRRRLGRSRANSALAYDEQCRMGEGVVEGACRDMYS